MEIHTAMPNKLPSPHTVVRELAEAEKSLDPFYLAQRWGVAVVLESWHPATWGEYDRRNAQIYLNKQAPVSLQKILAHELGHFWIHQQGFQLSRKEEETWVEAFADELDQSKTLCITKA